MLPIARFCSHTTTSRSWFRKEKGRRISASTVLKIVGLAPIPSANVITAMAVKPGRFSRVRIPSRRSLIIESIKISSVLLSLFHNPPILELHAPLAVSCIRFAGRYLNNGGALFVEALEHFHDLFALARVQVAGRLISDD